MTPDHADWTLDTATHFCGFCGALCWWPYAHVCQRCHQPASGWVPKDDVLEALWLLGGRLAVYEALGAPPYTGQYLIRPSPHPNARSK